MLRLSLFVRKHVSGTQLQQQIPPHVSAARAGLRAHARAESLPLQIVQTSPSRLAGAGALTSPIHPRLDACQPGAARAVSMEMSNKGASAAHFSIHLHGARSPENKPSPEFFPLLHLSLKSSSGVR